MKKFLIFMLVLGMVSAANAVLTVNKVGSAVTVDGNIPTDLYVIVVSTGGTLSPLDSTALRLAPTAGAAPTMSGYFSSSAEWASYGLPLPGPEGAAGGVWTMMSAPGELYLTGNYLTLSVTGGSVYAAWYNEVEGTYGEIIPEPATIALLGLGGLLLRRRK